VLSCVGSSQGSVDTQLYQRDQLNVRQSRQKLLGVLLACGGCVLLVFNTQDSDSSSSSSDDAALGILYELIADLGGVGFILASKQLLKSSYDPLVIVTGAYGVGVLSMTITVFIFKIIIPGEINPELWYLTKLDVLALIYAVLICGSCNFFILAWANQHLAASSKPLSLCLRSLHHTLNIPLNIFQPITPESLLYISTLLSLFLLFERGLNQLYIAICIWMYG